MTNEFLSLEVDQELLEGFVEEALESLAEIDSLLVQLESKPGDLEIVNAIFRPMHSIKGNAPFFGLTNLRNLAHSLEDLLAMVRDGRLEVNRDLTGILLEGADQVSEILRRAGRGEPELLDKVAFSQLLDRVATHKQSKPGEKSIKRILEQASELQRKLSPEMRKEFESLWNVLEQFAGGTDSSEVRPIESAEVKAVEEVIGREGAAENTSKRAETHKTMRVSEEHIDTFLGFVGELLILGEMLSYLERRVSSLQGANELSTEFKRINESYVTVSENLQKSLMAVRKVAVKGVLQKVPRLVRDIAQASQKEIEVVIRGDEIEVDKSLIELIDAPLTHMVRNAADHGIEVVEKRLQAGKSAAGTIQVDVEETDTHIVVRVKDDGAGLNYERIQRKAEELGIVESGRQLTHEQVVDFLFCAGVSTAEKVTDISGRGVGMDVVKRSIEAAGGSIKVESTAGQGSVFSIYLVKSVTTTIIEGLVFSVGDQFFVAPTERVNEIFFLRDAEKFSSVSKEEYVIRQERVMPLVPAHKILDIREGQDSEREPGVVISLTANRREVGLLVHGAQAVQQVVVKQLRHMPLKRDVYSGGALIGDGHIALILDVDKFCEGYDLSGLAERSQVLNQMKGGERQEDDDHSLTETLLLTGIGHGRQAAIPLSDVNRLEKIAFSQIEKSRGMSVVQYRGSLLPLFDLAGHFTHTKLERQDTDQELQVVVWSGESGQVGLIVNEILDIVEDRFKFEKLGEIAGVLGTAVVKQKVTDILQISRLLQSVAPELLGH